MERKIKGFRSLNGKGKSTSFKGCPCLVNKQYKHRTLGELVKMYRMTGEMPPVGQRQGVFLADKDIDSDFPTTGDEFDDIMNVRSAAKDLRDTSQKLDESLKAAAEQSAKDKDRKIAELQAQLNEVNKQKSVTGEG